jgi:hypothetical protein
MSNGDVVKIILLIAIAAMLLVAMVDDSITF